MFNGRYSLHQTNPLPVRTRNARRSDLIYFEYCSDFLPDIASMLAQLSATAGIVVSNGWITGKLIMSTGTSIFAVLIDSMPNNSRLIYCGWFINVLYIEGIESDDFDDIYDNNCGVCRSSSSGHNLYGLFCDFGSYFIC